MTEIITDHKYTFQFTNDNNNNMIENYFYGFNTSDTFCGLDCKLNK